MSTRGEEWLSGQGVLITGAASGIGAATVSAFESAGADVVATDLTYESESSADDATVRVPLDVRDRDRWEVVVDRARDEVDGLDVLINVAGVGEPTGFEKVSHDQFQEMLAVNTWGVWNGCKAVFPELAHSDGVVVNVASIAAVVGATGYAGYAASKGAVVALTRSLAAEFGPYGIRVNAVSPGTIRTPRTIRDGRSPGEDPRVVDRIPLGRVGTPEEVANCIRFLASPEAGYVTGANLRVDGG